MKMPAELANEIYDVLVETCGAGEHTREEFVRAFSDERYGSSPTEFRFCGKYGMAGKFWWNGGRFYVSGWGRSEISPSDHAEQTKELARVDARLQAIHDKWAAYPPIVIHRTL